MDLGQSLHENLNFQDEDAADTNNGPSKKQRLQNQQYQQMIMSSQQSAEPSNRYQPMSQIIEESLDINPGIMTQDHVTSPTHINDSEDLKSRKKRTAGSKQPRQASTHHLQVDTQPVLQTIPINKNSALQSPQLLNEGNSSASLQQRGLHHHGKARRRDQFGTRIQKGGRRHKVSFPDQLANKSITEIFIIESYKKYNRSGIEEEEETQCHCNIF